MFEKPVEFAAPLRRSIGVSQRTMALWAAAAGAAITQITSSVPIHQGSAAFLARSSS
jgi:hypothetical protein